MMGYDAWPRAIAILAHASSVTHRDALARLLSDVGGECRDEGPFVAENALRGRWRMRCRGGDLRVSITLAPVEPATVQFLEVAPLAREEDLAPAPVCR